jgi:hypothetical protein
MQEYSLDEYQATHVLLEKLKHHVYHMFKARHDCDTAAAERFGLAALDSTRALTDVLNGIVQEMQEVNSENSSRVIEGTAQRVQDVDEHEGS